MNNGDFKFQFTSSNNLKIWYMGLCFLMQDAKCWERACIGVGQQSR